MAQMFKTTIMIMISWWNLCFGFSHTRLHQVTPKDTKTLKSQTVTPKEHGITKWFIKSTWN